jgi:propionate CoA-transferase
MPVPCLPPERAEEALRLIPDGATVAISGNGSILQPERLLEGLEELYRSTGHPRDLTLFYPVVIGTGPGTGIDHLAHDGLVRGVIASCFDIWGIDRLARMVREGRVTAHCLPMGVMFQLLHAAADGQPGILTRIGLDTFVDPEVRGTGHNPATPGSLARRMVVDGETYLYYAAPPIDAALVRASVADEDGNLSLYREPIRQAVLTMALAARARRGPVIAQVQAVLRRGTLHAAQVDVPGCLVDAVVVDPAQRQTSEGEYDPSLTGEWVVPLGRQPLLAPLALGPDKIMARRAACELRPGMVVNLGFGLATAVAAVAAEEGIAEELVLSVEHGPLGGAPAGSRVFGAAVSPTCILRSTDVFALYHSGQLGLAILSAAEVDEQGNANVSRFADVMPGPGGYIDITAGSPRLILLSALRAGGTRVELEGAGLRVRQEGRLPRFVRAVRERTFSGRAALARGARVQYVTDRCTFELTPEGLLLTEVAPGIDVGRDILAQMEFRPLLAPEIRRWPPELFRPGSMGLRERWRHGDRSPQAPAQESAADGLSPV